MTGNAGSEPSGGHPVRISCAVRQRSEVATPFFFHVCGLLSASPRDSGDAAVGQVATVDSGGSLGREEQPLRCRLERMCWVCAHTGWLKPLWHFYGLRREWRPFGDARTGQPSYALAFVLRARSRRLLMHASGKAAEGLPMCLFAFFVHSSCSPFASPPRLYRGTPLEC